MTTRQVTVDGVALHIHTFSSGLVRIESHTQNATVIWDLQAHEARAFGEALVAAASKPEGA